MTDDLTPLDLTDIVNVCVGGRQEDRRLFDGRSLSFKLGGKSLPGDLFGGCGG